MGAGEPTLDQLISGLVAEEPKFDGLTEKVDDKFDTILDWTSKTKWLTFTPLFVTGGISWGLDDYLRSNRDDIKKWIGKALDGDPATATWKFGLRQLMAAVNLPSDLIKIADEWKSIGGEVTEAYNDAKEAKLSAYWQSPGARKYEDARERQLDAFTGLVALCETIATEFNGLAVKARVFYNELLNGVLDLVSHIGKFVSTAVTPSLVTDTGTLVESVMGAAKVILNAINSIVLLNDEISISMNTVHQAFTQAGMPDQKWPGADASNYNDGSITDGDRSQWTVIATDGGQYR